MVSACASGRAGVATSDVSARPSAAEDSVRTATLNRRIEAANARDQLEREARASDPGVYRIGKSDQVEVAVFGADVFSGTFRVEESGDIAMPLLGSVAAAGKTPPELEEHLRGLLTETYMRDPSVTVRIAEMQSHGVSVVGAVGRPGVYQLPGPSSLLEVLAMAEGLTAEAGNRVFVLRRSGSNDVDSEPTDRDLIEVNLGTLLESGSEQENITIRAGDIVQVRPAGLVYVVGEVNRPGGFTVPSGEPINVLQALAMAEGLGRTARASRTIIVRDGPDGAREEIPVDLDAVLKGDADAPTLNERDVLFVPNSRTKSVTYGVVGALVSMVTLRGLIY
jgi:polysaccharide export outer membrane protein